VPWLPRELVLEAIKEAAVMILPSTWYEGFPMTMVEAFACGTPVICSRLGAMQEIVSDGYTGLHFTAGDPIALSDKVESLFSDSKRLSAMGRAARRTYEELYTAERNYRQLIEIFERTISASCTN
jgi:glycosyltransferase involved in cell wall biosynthesis